MADKTKIIVAGASGRMGRMLVQAVLESDQCTLVGATERAGNDWIGCDLGECLDGKAMDITVADDLLDIIATCHAVLDFTTPEATLAHSELTAQARVAHVIGTTGLSDADLGRIAAAARHAQDIRAGNFSLGVNLLTVLTQKVAAALDADFDIEIVEMHHKHKVDAPSGTALMLGKAAAAGRGSDLAGLRDAARDGVTGERKRGNIGFAALRGGDVVGEHEVVFAGAGERVSLKHIATDRMLFARGAVKAAIWGHHQKPGEYSMLDVLGL